MNSMPEETPEWLPERLDRAKRAAVQEVLARVGFADVDSLEHALAEQRDQLSHLQTSNAELTAHLEEAQSAHRQILLEAAFIQAAAPYRFIHLDEARLLLDWGKISIDEEGGGVVGLPEALADLVAERPHLVRRPSPPPLAGDHMGKPPSRPRFVGDMPSHQVESLKRRFKLG